MTHYDQTEVWDEKTRREVSAAIDRLRAERDPTPAAPIRFEVEVSFWRALDYHERRHSFLQACQDEGFEGNLGSSDYYQEEFASAEGVFDSYLVAAQRLHSLLNVLEELGFLPDYWRIVGVFAEPRTTSLYTPNRPEK